jgi:tetratricopeptide (TPR) repeat protein
MDFLTARTRRIAAWALFGIALTYAFIAGLRTVSDFDVGWLLAMGRHLVVHHQVPRTDVLSYTALGTPWIYPPFGGALLYLAYAWGGFSVLSWVGALACVAVVAICIGRPRLLTCGLSILAIPSIAFRTAPRADLFTTLLYAAFLAVLYKYRRDGKIYGWLLPFLMLAWVNTHPGFAAGLVLLGLYVAGQLLEFSFPLRRQQTAARLKTATPWIALTVLATLINPWGIRVYQGYLAQSKIMQLLNGLVGEWSGVRLTLSSFAGAFQLRDPESTYWWLLIFGCVAAVVALFRRQFAHALLLAGAAYFSVEHVRFQALFAVTVIVISGEVFSQHSFQSLKPTLRALSHATVVVALAALALVHIADRVENRSYLISGDLSLFGTGLSEWYPQRAAQFIESNELPGELFSDYNSAGYLTLRLGPRYPDFADGRQMPFFPSLLQEQATLTQSGPDSATWKQAADRYGINTIVLSLARTGGLGFVPLQQYCASRDWKPVYLDDVSIVLVRSLPENTRWLQGRTIDCASYRIVPSSSANVSTARGRAGLYNSYANMASIYYLLGRDRDAAEAIRNAQNLFSDDPNLLLLAGQLFQANGHLADAEAQYRSSLQARSTDTGWFLLAQLLLAKKDYPQAAWALQHSADLAISPAWRYELLGNIYLAMNRPHEALEAFGHATYFGERLAALPIYSSLKAQVAEGRGRAWLALQNPNRAASFLEEATRGEPNSHRWNLLADCYSGLGLAAAAEQARAHAKLLSTTKEISAAKQ